MVSIEYFGKCLLVDKRVLVVGDLHFGFGDAMRESGYLVRDSLYEDIIKDFDAVFDKVGDVEEIILLGDLKHVFGRIMKDEWKHVLEIIDYLKKKCEKIIIVKGNHDVLLDKILSKGRKVDMVKCQENTSLDHTQSTSIAKGTLMKDQQGVTVDSEDGREDDRSGAKKVDGDKVWQIKTVDYYINAGVCYLHGNKNVVEASDCSSWFIGHGHPAVSIGDGVRKEKYKCFLVGSYLDKEVVIVPSFFPLIEGTDVSEMKSGEEMKLAWDFDLDEFEVKVVDGLGVRGFGRLKELRN